MITIIHLRDSPFVGGPEKQILGQCARLDRSRFEPIVVSFSTCGKNALTEAAAVEGIRTESIPDGKLQFAAAVGRLRWLLRGSENPIVVTSGYRADYAAQSACSHEHALWTAWFHGFTGATLAVRVYEALDMRLLRGARSVVAVCERTARHLRASGLPRVRVVPNGIDAEAVKSMYDRRSARKELGLGENELAVGVISRLSPEKGVEVFIDSAAEVLRTHPRVKFPIIGDGPLLTSLRRHAESLGIADRVIFAGFREDAAGLMKALDVFVLPSLRENLPVALLEAMACGVSVVATDVGGVSDVLDGTPAVPVPAGAARPITQAVSALLDDRISRESQAKAMIKRVRDFSFDRHVELMEAVYEEFSCRTHNAASVTRTEAACQSGGRPYRGD